MSKIICIEPMVFSYAQLSCKGNMLIKRHMTIQRADIPILNKGVLHFCGN